jgi:hypothetical protein
MKAAENKRPPALTQQILSYPQQHKYQTMSHSKINTRNASNTPLLPRVITPMTSQAAYLRVPTCSQNLSPRNLSQDDLWSMKIANVAIALGKNHWSQQHLANAVVHPITGKQMECMALMNDLTHDSLWNSQVYQKTER